MLRTQDRITRTNLDAWPACLFIGTTPVSPSARGAPVINVPSSWNSSCPPRCICAATHGEVSLSAASDDDFFAFYHMRLCPQFPFVVLPPGTTAATCKAERPLLFAAIKMAASVYNPSSMRAQMYQLVAQISEQLLISSTRSMDALQALLVTLGWFHSHCVMHAQLSSLLHLAQALLADLGLTREPAVHERTSVMVLVPEQPPPRKMEDKRAVLGIWFLTSLYASSAATSNPLCVLMDTNLTLLQRIHCSSEGHAHEIFQISEDLSA